MMEVIDGDLWGLGNRLLLSLSHCFTLIPVLFQHLSPLHFPNSFTLEEEEEAVLGLSAVTTS